MSFIDDEFDTDIPDAPEAPDVPDTPDAPTPPDTPDAGTPDVPGTQDVPTASQNDALGKVTIDADPASNVYNAAAPSVQIQQDIASLNDNSDLDMIKGSGPATAESTKPAPPESTAQTLAKQTIGADNMSRAPAAPNPFIAGAVAPGASAAVPEKTGIISSAMNWAKENQTLAAALVTFGAGALGGAGKALVDKQTMERKTELEQANAKDLFAYKQAQSRDFSAAGTLQNPNVMQPGIINGGLKRVGGGNVYDQHGRLVR